MQISNEVTDRFYAGNRTDTVRFVINDPVRIESNSHAGRTGAVMSIISLVPEATSLVESGSQPHGDLRVPQSDLELLK